MNKKTIEENRAIQDGLERFLDQELGDEMRLQLAEEQQARQYQQVQPQQQAQEIQPAKQLQTEFAREIHSSYSKGMRDRKPEYPEETKKKKDKNQKETKKKKSRKQEEPQKKNRKNQKEAKKNHKKQKKSKWKKVLIILLIALAAAMIWWYLMVGKIYNQMNQENISGIASEPLKKDGVTNVLLIGNDSRDNGEDGRSDAMILLSISNKTKTIHMTSLLRDMYVEIPGHDGNRLNAAYAYGGPGLLCETIEHNLGIEVNRYVLVNFQAFAALVDAVGGIDLEVTNEEVQWINAYLNEYNLLEGKEMTTDYLDTSLSGEIHLNGPQALAYSRNRYIGTDFGRTERQRKVLSAVMKKLPIAMATGQDELMEGLFPNLTTNLTQAEMFGLSMDAGKLLSYEILQTVIPAEGTYSNASIRGMSVLEVDYEANKAIIQKEIYGEEE